MRIWMLVAGIGTVALAGTGIAAAAPKGDAAHGQQVFARCAACHKVGPNPARAIGPALNGVVGRAAGSAAGYSYSPAMKAAGIKWNAGNIDKLLQGPTKLVPGTKMIFPGLQSAQDRADVVAYLAQYNVDGSKK